MEVMNPHVHHRFLNLYTAFASIPYKIDFISFAVLAIK